MTSISIFIYGWLIEPDEMVGINQKQIGDDCYSCEKYVTEKTKDIDFINVIHVNRDYDSIDLNSHPYYVYLNYVDMGSQSSKIKNKKFKALKRLNKSKNKILDLDKDSLLEIESDLNIDLKNPQIYIDSYDIERGYETF
jgi:hypothetical protein